MKNLCGKQIYGTIPPWFERLDEAMKFVTCLECRKRLLRALQTQTGPEFVEVHIGPRRGHVSKVVIPEGYVMRWNGVVWQMMYQGDGGWGV